MHVTRLPRCAHQQADVAFKSAGLVAKRGEWIHGGKCPLVSVFEHTYRTFINVPPLAHLLSEANIVPNMLPVYLRTPAL